MTSFGELCCYVFCPPFLAQLTLLQNRWSTILYSLFIWPLKRCATCIKAIARYSHGYRFSNNSTISDPRVSFFEAWEIGALYNYKNNYRLVFNRKVCKLYNKKKSKVQKWHYMLEKCFTMCALHFVTVTGWRPASELLWEEGTEKDLKGHSKLLNIGYAIMSQL